MTSVTILNYFKSWYSNPKKKVYTFSPLSSTNRRDHTPITELNIYFFRFPREMTSFVD